MKNLQNQPDQTEKVCLIYLCLSLSLSFFIFLCSLSLIFYFNFCCSFSVSRIYILKDNLTKSEPLQHIQLSGIPSYFLSCYFKSCFQYQMFISILATVLLSLLLLLLFVLLSQFLFLLLLLLLA